MNQKKNPTKVVFQKWEEKGGLACCLRIAVFHRHREGQRVPKDITSMRQRLQESPGSILQFSCSPSLLSSSLICFKAMSISAKIWLVEDSTG